MNNFQAFFHAGGNSHKTPSPGRVAKVVHSPWTAPRDKKKHRTTYDSTLSEVDEEGLQQGLSALATCRGHRALLAFCAHRKWGRRRQTLTSMSDCSYRCHRSFMCMFVCRTSQVAAGRPAACPSTGPFRCR